MFGRIMNNFKKKDLKKSKTDKIAEKIIAQIPAVPKLKGNLIVKYHATESPDTANIIIRQSRELFNSAPYETELLNSVFDKGSSQSVASGKSVKYHWSEVCCCFGNFCD